MKDWYLLLRGDIIADAIEYPVDGYTHVQMVDTHLPAGINAGWYRWNGTTYVLDAELKSQSLEEIIKRERQAAQDELLLDLLEREAI